MATWQFAGVQINWLFSCTSTVAQVGLRVPTPLAGRISQFPCELLAWLQGLASTGS